ncbi:MAG TPA: phosphotransferase [Candidatus Methylomirabilis sp.]|nr:phosphotransferase [Candidatus Methylomirabilis sp.]
MTDRLDLAALRAGLAALCPAADPVAAEVSELAGDASTRRYYRVRTGPGAPLPSIVVMRYPDEVPPEAELPFLNVHRYLTAAGVPVPVVYRSDPGANLLFLEDAGDTMLEDAFRDRGSGGCLPLYEQCVEILVRIQSGGTSALDGKSIPSRLSFDVPKFTEEIGFFFEHAVREYGGIRLSDREERAIGDLFLPFLERLSALPRVLSHRDYHSRNVMVLDPAKAPGDRNLRVLDFQDARMGNVFYDLASLLRDSYVTLPEDAVDHLRYAWRHAATAELRSAAGDPGAFAWRFDLAALQRNVKAIGTFGNQAHNRGKRMYLRFIPPTVAHLRGNFERNPPMRALAGRLLPILSALAEKAAAESPS